MSEQAQSLLGPSKTKILQLLKTRKQTAIQIGSRLRIQTSASRKHLEQLVQLGLASESVEVAGVGRPKKYYQLTDKGREMFPRSYDVLLNSVIRKLVETKGDDYTEMVMKDIAQDTAKTIDSGDARQTLKLAQQGLNRLGFDASVDKNNGNLTVISRNCPVWKTALEHGEVVCRGFHANLLHKMLKMKNLDRTEWMVTGDSYCRHTLSE